MGGNYTTTPNKMFESVAECDLVKEGLQKMEKKGQTQAT